MNDDIKWIYYVYLINNFNIIDIISINYVATKNEIYHNNDFFTILKRYLNE